MCNDTNDFLQFIFELEAQSEQDNQPPIKVRRKRKSKLEDYRVEILQKRATRKTFQQIADYLENFRGVKCDKSTVYDFCRRCISE